MKKRILLTVVVFLIFAIRLVAQPEGPPDGPPVGGSGEELDSVPLAGGLLYFIMSLIVGGFSLLRRKKGSK